MLLATRPSCDPHRIEKSSSVSAPSHPYNIWACVFDHFRSPFGPERRNKCAERNYVTFLRQRNTFWGYVLQGLHLLTESFVLYWILHHFVVVLVQKPAVKIHWVLINRPIIKYIVFPLYL